MRWLDGITDLTDMSLNKVKKIAKDREGWFISFLFLRVGWIRKPADINIFSLF